MPSNRSCPVGAEVTAEGVHFRIWAPLRKGITAVVETADGTLRVPLHPESGGYFAGSTSAAKAGDLYRFEVVGEDRLFPDPASRFQPDGPHGPSQIVDPSTFSWSDAAWRGAQRRDNVLYELHIGTFTREGTWAAAIEKLPHLATLGVTLIELMPVADFNGEFGWGYDGVDLFAPTRLYGTPDDFRRFVDAAHRYQLGVILDVVYNHFGPEGNYLHIFSQNYYTDRYQNDWGQAINYDGEKSAAVREFIVSNAAYWIREFHLDGLRLDATQDVHDASDDHVLAALTRSARAAAGDRKIFIVAENEPQHVRHVMPDEAGGYGMDAVWNDDLHHSATVALTGHNEAYYTDYQGTPQELLSGFKWGYLYQGQWYRWQKKRRGTATRRLSPRSFVTFLQNHDQVANSGSGARCHQTTSPALYRAMTGLFLLAPGTPMLFQGQEFAASSPFLYFASHPFELARLVAEGRKTFLSQFPSVAEPSMRRRLPEPADPKTFQRCRLDWSETETHADTLRLHRDLLQLRRTDRVLSRVVSSDERLFDGAVLSTDAFVLRFFDDEEGLDRLLLVNLGRDLTLSPAPEPLLAEPAGCEWRRAWSSEDPHYGGQGMPPHVVEDQWFLQGRSTSVFISQPRTDSATVEKDA